MLISILAPTSEEETLSPIKVVKALSFRQARLPAPQSMNSANTAFLSARCRLLYGSNSLLVWMRADWLQNRVTSRKINQHCSHLCSVDTNTYTTCKAVPRQNIYSLPKQGFYLCHVPCIDILELDLSLFFLIIEDFFQEHCVIRNKGVFSSAFLFVILETYPNRHRTVALCCSNLMPFKCIKCPLKRRDNAMCVHVCVLL